jgi:hypothetical protein
MKRFLTRAMMDASQRWLLRWSLVGAIAAAAVVGLPSSSPVGTLAPALAAPADADLLTYREPNRFSLNYPRGWRSDRLNANYVILTNYDPNQIGTEQVPTGAVKTEAILMEQPIEEALRRYMAGIDPVYIARRQALQVGDRPARRLWVADDPNFDFPDGIYSFVSCGGDRTVILASYYTASDPHAASLIVEQHNSLQCLP